MDAATLEAQAVKSGSFVLKSGITSPIYLNLRALVSNPRLLSSIASLLHALPTTSPYHLLGGVPYTALPIASALSAVQSVPMLLRHYDVLFSNALLAGGRGAAEARPAARGAGDTAWLRGQRRPARGHRGGHRVRGGAWRRGGVAIRSLFHYKIGHKLSQLEPALTGFEGLTT